MSLRDTLTAAAIELAESERTQSELLAELFGEIEGLTERAQMLKGAIEDCSRMTVNRFEATEQRLADLEARLAALEQGAPAPAPAPEPAPAPAPEPAPAPAPAPAPEPQGGAFLRPFSDRSVWNTPVAPTAIFASEADLALVSLRRSRRMSDNQPGGFPNINTSGSWNYPIYQARSTDPKRVIRVAESWATRSRRTRPIEIHLPAGARPPGGTDAPLIIFDPDGRRIHEFGGVNAAVTEATTYTCWDINGLGDGGTERIDAGINYAAGVIDMSIPGVPGRASGLPMCAGILRLEHFAMGRIPHALAFTMAGGDQCSPWVWPATRDDWPDAYANNSDPRNPRGSRDGYVATGMIFAIPPGPLPTDLQPATRIILRALQDFGTICVDRGGESSLLIDGSQPMAEWNRVLTSTVKAELKREVPLRLRRIVNVTPQRPKG